MENLPNSKFSDYIVYVDESGDHNLSKINNNYPVFVLSFCIFHKKHYSEKIVSALENFKFKHFGHDCIILHEHEIRKEQGDFRIFNNKKDKDNFIGELSEIITDKNFVLIACVINKTNLKYKYKSSDNPYHIALKFGLERIFHFLKEKAQENKITHIIFEARGKKEDKELELEFLRICSGENFLSKPLAFKINLVNKQSNSTGLQFADLTARPIGLHVIRPKQANRAFEILENKFYCKGGRNKCGKDYFGYGLKVFP